MVKNILFVAFSLFLTQSIIGQTYIGAHFNAGLAGAFVKATAPYNSLNQAQHDDSLKEGSNTIFAPAFGIHLSKRLKRYDEIYIGLRYQVYGWGSKRFNLQFNDSIHRDIGKIQALQTPGDVQYRYRFYNISIPIYYMKSLRFNEMPMGMSLALYGGGAINLLLSQKATAETIGFTAFGKQNFDLPTDIYDMLPVNLSLQGGLRMRQDLGDDIFFTAMPGFGLIPIPSRNESQRQFQYRLQVNLGISKAF